MQTKCKLGTNKNINSISLTWHLCVSPSFTHLSTFGFAVPSFLDPQQTSTIPGCCRCLLFLKVPDRCVHQNLPSSWGFYFLDIPQNFVILQWLLALWLSWVFTVQEYQPHTAQAQTEAGGRQKSLQTLCLSQSCPLQSSDQMP